MTSRMGSGLDRVRNLKIWHESVEVVKAVYMLTQSWPKEEFGGLTHQARRAEVSIPANPPEGPGREIPEETTRFAQIALDSLYELHTLVCLSAELRYSSNDMFASFRERRTSLAKRTSSFIHYQEARS